MIRGYLKFMVLKLLEKKPMSGYSIMKTIHDEIGAKPSPGSIYPLLEMMANDKEVRIKRSGRKKIYELTAEGKKQVKDIDIRLKAFSKKFSEGLRILESMSDTSNIDVLEAVMLEMRNGTYPIYDIYDDISELKHNIIKILLEKDSKKINKLGVIIRSMNKKVLTLK